MLTNNRYEFRWCEWGDKTVYGDFVARSRPFYITELDSSSASVAFDASDIASTDVDGVDHLFQECPLTLQWNVPPLLGLTQDSRDRYASSGEKTMHDWVAAYPQGPYEINKYAYYWDVPENPSSSEMELDSYYTNTYVVEDGVRYTMRYIREGAVVAESPCFMINGGERGAKSTAKPPGGYKGSPHCLVQLAEQVQAEACVTADGLCDFVVCWFGFGEVPTSKSGFIALFLPGKNPYSDYAHYEYATGLSGQVKFEGVADLGLQQNTIYNVAYVNGETGSQVGDAATISFGEPAVPDAQSSEKEPQCRCYFEVEGKQVQELEISTLQPLEIGFSGVSNPSDWDYVAVYPKGDESNYLSYAYNSNSEGQGSVTLALEGYLENQGEYEVKYFSYAKNKAVGIGLALTII